MAAALGNGADEIAAEAEERLDLARQDALAGLDGVHALVARRLEPELFRQLVERHQFGLFGNADSALALDVGMAANRRDAGAVAADVSLEQQHVDKHGDVLEAVGVLGQPHAVDADDAVGFDIDLRGRFDVGTRQTRSGLDLIP